MVSASAWSTRRRQPLQRPLVARVGLGRRPVGAVDLDQRAELAPEAGHQLSCGPPRRSSGPSVVIFGDQVVEPDRLARRGDDRRHRRVVLRAEAVDQQGLEIAERDAAIDRPPRGEGDDQRVGAPGRAFRPLRVAFSTRPRRASSSAIRAASAGVGAGAACGGGRLVATVGTRSRRLGRRRGRDAEEARGAAGNAPAPRSRPRRRRGPAPGRSAAARSSPCGVRVGARSLRRGLVAQPRREGQQRRRRSAARRPRRSAQPSPAASAAASLIAAIGDRARSIRRPARPSRRAGARRMDQRRPALGAVADRSGASTRSRDRR